MQAAAVVQAAAGLQVAQRQLLDLGGVAPRERLVQPLVLLGDAQEVVVLPEQPAHAAAQDELQLVEELVARQLGDALVEVGGGAARGHGVAGAGGVQLGVQRGAQPRQTGAGVALRGQLERQHLQRGPHLVEVGDVARRELADDRPRARAQRDEPFGDEHLQRVAHRHPAHPELGREIALDEPAARRPDAVEDVVAEQPGHPRRLGLAALAAALCAGPRAVLGHKTLLCGVWYTKRDFGIPFYPSAKNGAAVADRIPPRRTARPGSRRGLVVVAAGLVAGVAALSAACSASEPASAEGDPSRSVSAPARTTGTNADATAKLTAAVARGDTSAAAAAVKAGADLEARDGDGRTPLVAATKARRTDMARLLLDAGADPNAKDGIQDSAFLYAGAEGLDDILRLTLAHGADVKSTNRYGGTALIPASEHAHVETVRILLKAGVPVNHVNNLSWTALHEAIVLGNGDRDHVTVVELLLAGGADPSIRDGKGVLPRDLAAQRGYQDIVKAIDRAS
ncbi:ankyrin [Actinomadura verrucosospora]|uniref:Ankyrin n=1 Tax=Actinomadura verrucosospora TaxID=46165 RepID=A0A7D3VV80_ACTVE|nr:ankyrin [Actinomadura verrucosospora]